MKCQKCLNDFNENEIEAHHLHPRFIGNSNGLGKKLYLCKKCHMILHLMISSWMLKHIDDVGSAVKDIINSSERWLK